MTLTGSYSSQGEQPGMKLGWGAGEAAVGFGELWMPGELAKLREIL